MKPIKVRAEEYAKRIGEEQNDAYIFTDADILVEQAFTDGFKEGCEDTTKWYTDWYNPTEELPQGDKEVLCMIDRYFQTYAVMRYLNHQWWQPLAPQPNVSLGGWIAAEKEPIAWRHIHEMDK